MAGFDSGSIVEPLDYTFEAHIPGCKGTVQEPNDRQIAEYFTGVKTLVKTYQDKLPPELMGVGTPDVTEMINALDGLDADVITEFHGSIAGLFAALCSGEPSRETLMALPPRIRTLFYGWLQQEVMAPEAAPGAGSGQVVTMPRAVAG